MPTESESPAVNNAGHQVQSPIKIRNGRMIRKPIKHNTYKRELFAYFCLVILFEKRNVIYVYHMHDFTFVNYHNQIEYIYIYIYIYIYYTYTYTYTYTHTHTYIHTYIHTYPPLAICGVQVTYYTCGDTSFKNI